MKEVFITILIIVVAFLFGYYFFKLRKKDFTPNAQIIISILFDERNNLEKEISDSNTTDEEKKKMIERKDEIDSILEQFYGIPLNQITA